MWNPNSDLDYIHWCLNHNFIQQALTLYIELIPEVLMNKNKYKKNQNAEPILQIIDRKKIEREHKKSESPYTVEYYLVNQYSANADSRKKKLAKNDIKLVAKNYLTILEKFLSVKSKGDKKWFVKTGENIEESIVEEFFCEVNSKFNIDSEFEFTLDNINCDKVIVKVDEAKKNWVWLIQSITNPLVGLFKSYKETLKSLEFGLSDIEAKRYQDGSTKITIESIKQAWYKRCLENIEKKEVDKYEALLGYICLHNTWCEKVTTTQNDLNNKGIGYNILDIAGDCIALMNEEIDHLKSNDKRYELRANYLKVGQISLDEITPILLPYDIKPYSISEKAVFDKEISDMDSKSKVDNLQAMIDGDDNGCKTSGKLIEMNPWLLKKLSSKLHQLEFSLEIVSLLKKSVDNEEFKEMEEQYYCLIPTDKTKEGQDMWDRDNLSLLVLRTILYPYYELKLIRNDSVHARKERHKAITKKDVKDLIELSLATIEKYLLFCKIVEEN